ncbi:hypothetical protein ACIA8K_06980 [Catenuloplanes sp. NPDC051500]|uniref:hypothetical protein n=1 Tax=Catenuloplanes sp. NPDC051500 TaxID=3363959 RepID=UPI0037959FBD
MGPAPKPDGTRVRRNATPGTETLPSEGRTKPAPRWPLIPDVVLTTRHKLAEGKVAELRAKIDEAEDLGNPTGPLERRLDQALEKAAICEAQLREQKALESRLWKDLWKLPQAVAWERLGWTRDVAQYVRHKVMAELGDLDAAKEARQWSDRLGLSPMAMLRLRWRIASDEVGEKREQQEQHAAGARGRFKAVG